MSKKSTKKYTRPTLKLLVDQAVSMGVNVKFNLDMDGKYIITHRVISTVPNRPDLTAARDEIYTPDTVAMAHWLVWGMMAQAKSQLLGIQACR